MRLWHRSLVPFLPRQQLVAQYRECCAIAKNWAANGTPNHILVNKVMNYSPDEFITYTQLILTAFSARGYKTTSVSRNNFSNNMKVVKESYIGKPANGVIFHGWHNDIYLRECLYNLEEKAMCDGMTKEEWGKIYNQFKDFTPLWDGEKLD